MHKRDDTPYAYTTKETHNLPQADGSDEPEHTLPAHRNIRGKEYFIGNTNPENENKENYGNK